MVQLDHPSWASLLVVSFFFFFLFGNILPCCNNGSEYASPCLPFLSCSLYRFLVSSFGFCLKFTRLTHGCLRWRKIYKLSHTGVLAVSYEFLWAVDTLAGPSLVFIHWLQSAVGLTQLCTMQNRSVTSDSVTGLDSHILAASIQSTRHKGPFMLEKYSVGVRLGPHMLQRACQSRVKSNFQFYKLAREGVPSCHSNHSNC